MEENTPDEVAETENKRTTTFTTTTAPTDTSKKKRKNPYASFNVDPVLENDGRWIEYDAFQVKVARMGGGNTAYNKAMLDIGDKYKKTTLKKMNDKKSTKLLNELHIKTLIKGWEVWDFDDEKWVEGIHEFPSGKVVPVTFEAIENIFLNLKELKTDILEQSLEKSNYLKDDVVKN